MFAVKGIPASSPSRMESSQQPLDRHQASPISDSTLLYEAVSPPYRSEIMAATAGRLSRYTITATFHPPGPPLDATQQATPLTGDEASLREPSDSRATITGTQELR